MDTYWSGSDESTEGVLRRAHATYLRLHHEMRVAEKREAAAREHLAEVQRQADELCARSLPMVERITAAILAEADGEAATILAAAEARARDLTVVADEADRQVVEEIRRALDEARRTEREQVGVALSESQRRLDELIESAIAGEAAAAPPPSAQRRTRHRPKAGTDDEWLADLRDAVNALESLEPEPSDLETFSA